MVGQQRQVVLPFTKTIEIAWKSIRLRLGRSLLVTAGIALAIAFLAFIQTSELIEHSVPSGRLALASPRLQTRWVIGLALLVAFVGVINAMLMSVTERFREIGTMKCLGAMNGLIVRLFLIEGAMQGIAGSLVGAVGGSLVSMASAAWSLGAEVFHTMPIGKLAITLAIGMIIGIMLSVAGAIVPAWRAGRMQPVQAMSIET